MYESPEGASGKFFFFFSPIDPFSKSDLNLFLSCVYDLPSKKSLPG